MQVELYKGFIKRKNSTKQPTNITPVIKDVKLKGECSALNPSFFLADADSYTYLKAWGNYYFIDRVAFDINGAQYINCSIDVLASYKEHIQATSAFVKYSSSDYSNLLKDGRVATLVSDHWVSESEDSTWFGIYADDDACVILGSISQTDGIVQYAMTKLYYDSIIYDLFQATDDVIASLAQQFGSVSAGFIFAKRYPIDWSSLPTIQPQDLYIGNYLVPGAVGHVLTNAHIQEIHYLDIPWHYTDFRKSEPYQYLSVTLPFVGEVPLSVDDFLDATQVTIRMDASLVTGAIAYTIRNEQKIISVVNGTFGMDIPLATDQLSRQGIEGVMSAASAFGTSLGMGNDLGAAASIGGLVKSLMHLPQTSITILGGYSGNYGEHANTKYSVNIRYSDSNIEPNNLLDLQGRPCMKVRSLTGLTGYVETQNFSVAVEAIAEVRDLINSAMDRGVYIE